MNDNQFTLVGNIVRTPVLKRFSDNKSVASFRVASTPRRYDAALQDWRNLDSLFLTVNCWNKLAERVAECLHGGDPVIVTGRLRMRTFEVEGQRRTVYEVDAQHVAPDLNRVAVSVVRMPGRAEEATAVAAQDLPSMEPSSAAGPLVSYVSEPAA
jgi:single-strand DNA-binding protein